MKGANVLLVEIDRIHVNGDRRPLRNVGELAASIEHIGLINPITLTTDYYLIAGYHRLEACKRLGWTHIPAQVLSLDKIDSAIARIDENLVRNELTCLERGEQLAQRKELYEAQHPETRNGAQGGGREGVGTRQRTENEKFSFSVDAAVKTGVTPRTVQQEVQIATHLDARVKETIRQTPLADRKHDLLQLARLEPVEQRQVTDCILSGGATNVQRAIAAVREEWGEGDDWTPQERAAKIGWVLRDRGYLTNEQAGALVGLTTDGAYRLICGLCRVLPIRLVEHGRWVIL